MPIEPLMGRSRPESKIEVDETPRASSSLNLDRLAQEQMSEDLETRNPPEPTPSLGDLELSRIKPLIANVALSGTTLSSADVIQVSSGTLGPKGSHTPGENNRLEAQLSQTTRTLRGSTTDTTRRIGGVPRANEGGLQQGSLGGLLDET